MRRLDWLAKHGRALSDVLVFEEPEDDPPHDDLVYIEVASSPVPTGGLSEEEREKAEHDAALIEAQAEEYEDLEALYGRVVKAHQADMKAADALIAELEAKVARLACSAGRETTKGTTDD